MNQDESIRKVCEWLVAAQNRFKNMYDHNIDREGYPAIQKAIKQLEDTKKISVGSCVYIWNRSNEDGSMPTYNSFKGYNKKYGEMIPIDLNDLINSDLVLWESGRNGMQPRFAQAIDNQTNYKWSGHTLKRKPSIVVKGLFV